MFCTKCGNELRDGDSFCAKCGTKAGEAGSASAETAAKPGVKSGKKVVKRPAMKPRPLAANGICRYCGEKIDPSSTTCPFCGASGRAAAYSRPATMADVKRAGEIGKSLGGETSQEDVIFDGCFGDIGSLLLLPFVLLNPLFWMQWSYRSKAKEALKLGNLDQAQEYKSRSTIYAVGGWVLTILAIVVAWNIIAAKAK